MTKPKPKPPTQPTVAEFLTECLSKSKKKQCEIAQECGLESPNVITMWKKGVTKVPVTRIGALAKALEVDPAHLLRFVLTEYLPDAWASIEDSIRGTVQTANELEFIRKFRVATGNSDPKCVAITLNADGSFTLVVTKTVGD